MKCKQCGLRRFKVQGPHLTYIRDHVLGTIDTTEFHGLVSNEAKVR